jgi:hypothetical protein
MLKSILPTRAPQLQEDRKKAKEGEGEEGGGGDQGRLALMPSCAAGGQPK